jgi:hypothetical protein
MLSTKHKLRLAGAFAALATLALAVSCTGFFQNPTVSSITIDPPNPSVSFGTGASALQLTAAATFNDGSTGTLSGGTSCTGSSVCWSSSDTTVATVTAGGLLTGISAGTATITASSGAITGTTTATAAEVVTSMTITPNNAGLTANGQIQDFTIDGATSSGSQNISTLVTLTLEQSGSAVANGTSILSCTPGTDSNGNPAQVCTAVEGSGLTAATQYDLVVSYTGYTGTAVVQATVTITP